MEVQVTITLPDGATHTEDRTVRQKATENARSRLAKASAAGTTKVSKSEADYRQAFGPEYCGNCTYMKQDPGESVGLCEKVMGNVRASMVCAMWEPESGHGEET